ncbi:hypothetical protein ACSSS7_007265 [Eimeria intestinalis]
MERVLGTTDYNHPYVKYLVDNHSECYYVGGKVTPVNAVSHFNYEQYRMSPAICKERIKELNYDVVVGFQTRNPLHRCHYELIKHALRRAASDEKKRPMLLLSPVVGPTQPGDVPYYLRARCYEHVVRHFEQDPECAFAHLCPTTANSPVDSPPQTHRPGSADNIKAGRQGCSNAMLVLIPLAMRMAGPRECVLHARIRKNYGCTHFIVGRDHAGPSTRKKDGTPFYGPYDAHQLLASVSEKLGITPIFGEEMLYVGAEYGGYIPAGQLEELKKSNPQVQVNSISGTEFRKLLTTRAPIPEWFSFPSVIEELQQFYKQNHERGLCVYFTGLPCSGVYVEVYVCTPLSVCEQRDIKHLYKKARQGIIKQFTGVSDPYEAPEKAELTIDSSTDIKAKGGSVFRQSLMTPRLLYCISVSLCASANI